ncbi:MAG: serine protease [Candidatus Nomurabacteria bacterium]
MMDFSKVVEKIKPSIAFIITGNGTGSGFVFQKKGILITCNHVVEGNQFVSIRFPDIDNFIHAEVVLRDNEHDLAILKFQDDSRHPLSVCEVSNIKEGMPVIFSGYPLDLQVLTTHQGILSSISKDQTGKTNYLIDGTVNSGNSGCPLMDKNGDVVGIVNAKNIGQFSGSDLFNKVKSMSSGLVSISGVDISMILKILSSNTQMGIGYAVPVSYVPEHKDVSDILVEKVVIEDDGKKDVKDKTKIIKL